MDDYMVGIVLCVYWIPAGCRDIPQGLEFRSMNSESSAAAGQGVRATLDCRQEDRQLVDQDAKQLLDQLMCGLWCWSQLKPNATVDWNVEKTEIVSWWLPDTVSWSGLGSWVILGRASPFKADTLKGEVWLFQSCSINDLSIRFCLQPESISTERGTE